MPSTLLVVPRDGGAALRLPVFDRPVQPDWTRLAARKGYAIVARVKDRLHVALRCDRCGCVSLSHVYTLRTAHPLCPACLCADRSSAAEAAGAVFRRRDPADTRYAVYGLPCGHEVRRQFGLIARAAAGETGIRCEVCHAGALEAEAAARGWSLVGPDPQGDPNYRLYAHTAAVARPDQDGKAVSGAAPACGHIQRIARGNMMTGRFTCGACGQGWSVAASALYLMRFELPGHGPVVKLGFSRNPISRLRFQLRADPGLACELRRVVPVTSGHRAICVEKRMHAELRRRHPDAVVPPRAWRGLIRVRSEIYEGRLEPLIDAMLDRVAGEGDDDAVGEDGDEAGLASPRPPAP